MQNPGSLHRVVTRVLPDANVLYSRTLRDWLFLLKLESGGSMFTVSTTVDILAETIARYRDSNPSAAGEQITLIHDRILASVDERIDRYTVDGSWSGTDEEDAHVHAAAKDGGIDTVLTCDKGWENLAPEELDLLPYEAQHPDHFFCLVDTSSPSAVRTVIASQLKYWFDRNGEVDLPARLRAAQCPEFADRVRIHLQTLDCSFLGE